MRRIKDSLFFRWESLGTWGGCKMRWDLVIQTLLTGLLGPGGGRSKNIPTVLGPCIVACKPYRWLGFFFSSGREVEGESYSLEVFQGEKSWGIWSCAFSIQLAKCWLWMKLSIREGGGNSFIQHGLKKKYCWWFRDPKQPLFGCIVETL